MYFTDYIPEKCSLHIVNPLQRNLIFKTDKVLIIFGTHEKML